MIGTGPLHSSASAKGCVALLSGALLLLMQGCSKREEPAEQKAYRQQLEACSEQLQKDPLVPIVGGGYLDTRRLDFNATTVRFEDGQCGTDGFETSFYWTGEKIVPAGQKFTGLLPGQETPKHWRRLNVVAQLGNQRKARACQEHFDPKKCVDPKHKNPGLPPTWPEERIVRPIAYPGLEIWMPVDGYKKDVGGIYFVMKDWPRPDGTPREVNCWHLPGYDPSAMTKKDLEHLDFGNRTLPCQVEGWDFSFVGGAARISTGTEALRDITPALQALQQYISGSISRER